MLTILLNAKDNNSFANVHPDFWLVYCNWRFAEKHIYVQTTKKHLEGADVTDKVTKVKKLIGLLMERAETFVHEYNTCI